MDTKKEGSFVERVQCQHRVGKTIVSSLFIISLLAPLRAVVVVDVVVFFLPPFPCSSPVKRLH